MATKRSSRCVFSSGAVLVALLLVMVTTGYAQEFRSIEATSWSSAFESSSAVTTFVNYANSCNLNAIIPEIRLRSDAYYTSSIEPPGTGVAISPPGFDPLQDMINKAHPLGIEVHPWLVTFRVWTTVSGPGHTTPEHIWWTHGPGNTDPDQDWRMYSYSGGWDAGGIVNLDPGLPEVENYLITVFMDIVNRYDVDGLNLDYIRYPGTDWGYHPRAVQRFNTEYGRSGNPSAADATWSDWRRDQIANLVKRLYLEIKSVKPWVRLNADVWNSAATGNSNYFQNWDNWMLNHWMDFAHPMSYTSNNSTFSSWCDAYVGNQHGRHVYPLVDASNSITGNVLPQIDLVRSHGFQGLGLYSYQSIPNKSSLQSALVAGPFPSKVSVPDMSWLSSPTLGMLKGYVRNSAGNAIYPATVTIQSKSTKNTGTGFYGLVDLSTGTYTVDVSAPGYLPTSSPVTITAGVVSDLSFTLAPDVTPPVISNVRPGNVQATNAQILWDTDENANSMVEYGLTTSYGSQATNLAWVTAHTVQLISLSPATLYHYRVTSTDPGGNTSTSGDYTFITGSTDVIADIIVDNPEATVVGSWSTGTSATDKYGINYRYCTRKATEDRYVRWTPNIISAGNYDVYVWYPAGGNRTSQAPYTVYWNGGSALYRVDQKTNGGKWNRIAINKPFVVGTGGSVKLGNNTPESGTEQVMADAVRFAVTDEQPPTAPTGVTATATSTTAIQLNWTASTDNVAVLGYKIWRDGALAGTSTTTSYTDSGRTANTSYSYTVSAYDGVPYDSTQSSPAVSRSTLSLPPNTSRVTCNRAAGWYSTDGFEFTAVGGFVVGKVAKYRYAWTDSATYVWEGAEPEWNDGVLTQNVGGSGQRYLHVKGFNWDEVPNGTLDLGPYGFDTPPEQPVVTDDGLNTTSLDTLHATWVSSDPESGIQKYEYRIRAEGGATVRDWTDAATGTEVNATGLGLVRGQTYVFDVRATNNVGLVSEVGSSDGIMVFFDTSNDGHIDAADLESFETCGLGPDVAYATGLPINCGIFDMEPDGDVDQDDFGVVQRCYTGGALPTDPACLGW